MADFIGTVRKQIGEFLQKLSTKVKIVLIAALVLVIVVAIVAAVNLNKTKYTVLYSRLDAAEAGEILVLLEEMGVDAKAQGSDTILVPESQAPSLYMQLASQGYPQSGLNYDIYTDSVGFSTTDSQQQVMRQYQTQENLNTAISAMDKVESCISFVNFATNSSYVLTSNTTEASVSVLLKLVEGETLTSAEAKTIGHYVLKSVSDLKMENIRIMDTRMNYYDLTANDSLTYDTTTQYDLTEQMKKALKNQVTELLSPVFGSNNISTSINVQLNFDKEVQSSIEFAPPVYGEEEGIVRSKEELYEAIREYYADDGGEVGTDVNGVSAPDYVYDYSLDDNQLQESWQLTYNYEINETQTQIEKAQGYIEKLSVSVLINNADANASYGQQVVNLVAKAIGVDEKYVAVEFLPFTVADTGIDFEKTMDIYGEIMREQNQKDLIRTVIVALAVLLLVFMILRFFKKPSPLEAGEYIIDEDGNLVNINVDDDFASEYGDEGDEKSDLLSAINMEKPDMVKEIEAFVEKYPESAAQILRNWLSEDF